MMNCFIRLFSLLLVLCLTAPSARSQKPDLPSGIIPDGLGYNIHFTHAKPGELEMIADSGVKIIRMDFSWSATEKEKGVYDFSAFEHLTDSLEKHGLRPLYILDYSNRHYDGGLSPHSEEGRTAFARWAAAAVVHFKDRGILWEMYNEPNIHFWKPEPNPEKYILLALEVGRAIRQAAPNERYIGPAAAQAQGTDRMDFPFLEQSFRAGLLEYWDAVSVHPYRQKGPESVAEEYAKLRWLIDKYAPKEPDAQRSEASGLKTKKIPILSAEWGYSSAWSNFDDEKQGKMLPRQWMTNLAFDVPISIWYDWHDDGKDPKEPEHHFGTTNFEYLGNSPTTNGSGLSSGAEAPSGRRAYRPKPSYIAAKTFMETFKGFRFNKRLWTGDDEVFVFLFDKDDGLRSRLAAWTVSKEPKEITIPCSPGKFHAVSYLGEKLPESTADKDGLKLTVSDGPVYLIPESKNEYLVTASHWSCFPLAFCYDENVPPSMFPLRGTQVVQHSVKPVYATGESEKVAWQRFRPRRFHAASPFEMSTSLLGMTFVQKMDVYSTHPTFVSLPVPGKDGFVAAVDNPSGESFNGWLRLAWITGLRTADGNPTQMDMPFVLKRGEKKAEICFPSLTPASDEYRFAVYAVTENFEQENNSSNSIGKKGESAGKFLQHDIFPLQTYRIFADFTKHDTKSLNESWNAHPDGDKNVASEQKIEIDGDKLKLTFKFDDGWKFVRIFPKAEDARKLEGKPKALALQAQGDGTPVSINLRYRDDNGQTFQIHGVRLKDDSVRNLVFPLDGGDASHWGGPNDGVVRYPIRLDSIVVDGTRKAIGPGTVTFSSPVLVYEK